MKGWVSIVALLVLVSTVLFVAPVARAGTPATGPVDFTLETSSGKKDSLSNYRGKVVVIFYEDRMHVETNIKTKLAIEKYGAEHQLQDKVAVLAIANLKGLDFNPARDIARNAIRGMAQRFDVSIWMDWKGQLIDLLGVADENANVVVIDKQGVLTWKKTGRLGDAEQKEMLAAVNAAL